MYDIQDIIRHIDPNVVDTLRRIKNNPKRLQKWLNEVEDEIRFRLKSKMNYDKYVFPLKQERKLILHYLGR